MTTDSVEQLLARIGLNRGDLDPALLESARSHVADESPVDMNEQIRAAVNGRRRRFTFGANENEENT